MSKKVVFFLPALILVAVQLTQAQQAATSHRIGHLAFGSSSAGIKAFVQGLKDLGYVEGQNIAIEYRNAEGQTSRLPELAADLVRRNVAVIVAAGLPTIEAALKATNRIPIVMTNGGDPVIRGFVKSLSAPGGNVTGLSSSADGDEGKRIELLKEVFPWVSRATVLNSDPSKTRLANYLRQDKKLGVELIGIDVYSPEELKKFFAQLTTSRSDGLITVRDVLSIGHAELIAEFAIQNRLPSIYESREFIEKGGLMSYGVNYTASSRRSAFYVDKILKGANPAILPVEPPRFEFLINLKTAKKMGYRIRPEILLEANEVIN